MLPSPSYFMKGLFTAVPFMHYITSTFQQKMTRHNKKQKKKKKKHCLNRLNSYQSQNQVWYKFWNYQTRNFKILINMLKGFNGKSR